MPNIANIVLRAGYDVPAIVVNIAREYLFTVSFKQVNVAALIDVPYSRDSIHACRYNLIPLGVKYHSRYFTRVTLKCL